MRLKGLRPFAAAFAILPFVAGLVVRAQSIDPQAFLDDLIQRQTIESRQRFEDRQRERLLKQQEESYDGDICVRVGYVRNTPDFYQCVRDSAAARRSPDFSQYGNPLTSPNVGPRLPATTCDTLGDGEGGGITFCD